MTDNLEASEFEVFSQNLCGGTEEDQGTLIQDSRCPGRDSNQNPILRSKSRPLRYLISAINSIVKYDT
jgi:hypothetical protein